MLILPVLSIFALVVAQSAPIDAAAILNRYVQAIGGESALLAVKSRISEGEFDNGRGLNTRFRLLEEAPNRRLTLIGPDAVDAPTGSGRGFDGGAGWDKNFIGTGLRSLEGRELADAAREADMSRPLHLFDDCATTSVVTSAGANIVVCATKSGGRVKYQFDPRSGLLVGQETEAARPVRIIYDDYRRIDGVQVPFKTWIEVAGAVIKYNAQTIRQNQAVDRRDFARPAR